MASTSIAHASFITGLYAVLVPVVGPFFGRWPRPLHLAAAVLALFGLALLAGVSPGQLASGRGDLLVLCCAVASAFHILVTDRAARSGDVIALNWLQLAAVAVLSLVVAPFVEGPLHLRPLPGVVWGQLYLAVCSSGVAFTLQLWAQRRIAPGVAAMVFLLEAPFGALAGMLIFGERLSALQGVGAGLMLAGCFFAVASPAARLPPEATSLREAGL